MVTPPNPKRLNFDVVLEKNFFLKVLSGNRSVKVISYASAVMHTSDTRPGVSPNSQSACIVVIIRMSADLRETTSLLIRPRRLPVSNRLKVFERIFLPSAVDFNRRQQNLVIGTCLVLIGANNSLDLSLPSEEWLDNENLTSARLPRGNLDHIATTQKSELDKKTSVMSRLADPNDTVSERL
jgi:hypothetical protein